MALNEVVLLFSDGAERRVHVPDGGVLLDAALEKDIQLIHQCRTGSCSTCTCKVVEGDLRLEASTSVSIFPREIAAGERLSCLTRVYSDGVVRLPYSSTELDRAAPQRFRAEVTAIDRLSDTVVRLRMFAVEEAPPFESGMYFSISVPGADVRRCYSPVSRSSDLPEIEFLIRLLPGGAMSEYLTSLAAPGDVLELDGPHGEFRWNETKAPIILVAGGTGLAPVLSILDTIAAGRRHRERILLCFGVNRKEDLFFEEELHYRREMMPRLDVRISVVEPDQGWAGATGHVTGLIQPDDVKPTTEAFLCGPPPMVSAASERLKSFGLQENSIMFERFSAA
ncbi:2-polyprenylphenol hydroxylase-like oxidoreductase [Burkholderia sp. Ch1-1]|nr:2-polyprenylphenol hydroxylase-like oxidoreductase [Burkholderia sp. Ch1-1]